jgi:predicted nucleotidyltransferase component of viral defense system
VLWEEVVARSSQELVGTETVLREEVQKAVLTYFSQRRLFNEGVFQGGTALRLFYGNARHSEDLDFVFTREDTELFREIETQINNLGAFARDVFPFAEEITLKGQKKSRRFRRFTLRLSAPELGRVLRVNIEFANVPSRDNSLFILHYPPFNPAVRVESLREILADKVVAAGLRAYVKGRDLWDIHFLAANKGVGIDLALVQQKVIDYGSNPATFTAKLAAAVRHIHAEGNLVLEQEMKRFLPRNTAELYREAYPGIAGKVADLIETCCLHHNEGLKR